MAKPLGETQKCVLDSLHRHSGFWHLGCGWLWDTPSNTTKIMESLVKRGLVTKATIKIGGGRISVDRYDLKDKAL